MPIQAPQWTDYLNCPACCREFSPRRSPVSLSCGHTLCKPCLKNLIRKQCPFDQSVISLDLEELVVNTALLQLMGYDPPTQPSHPSSIQSLSEQDRRAYDVIVKSLEQLAVFLKYCCTASVNMIGSRLSRPMQRKLVTLLQCALMDEEGRGKAARAARSLGERTVSELILQHQNPQQLSANLWAAVRSRGCQFLGPAMQEEVLKLVLLALEDGSPLSRKVLVMFVVQRLEPHFPQASKTSIGHVVQLLYRASCFKVSKRESDSSLMQLKEEFRTYECLRREHDAQIVQIATESGLRIAPDQWSALLYGDTIHKSHMQSIIDKLQTPHSFAQSVQELFFALQRTGDPAQLLVMSISLDRLTNIDPSPDAKSPNWQELAQIMTSLKDVVSGLVEYMQHHAAARDANHNLKTDRLPDATTQPSTVPSLLAGRYKVAMCRDAQTRTFCPRGNNCTYAHTEEELERYRGQDNAPNAMPPPPPPLGIPAGSSPNAPRPVVPVTPFNYALPYNQYIRMPLQQVSPSGAQHGMPDNSDGPEEFEQEYARRRQSFERHQFDMMPPNNSDTHRSYANALMYGSANNRPPQNRNGGVSPLDVGVRQVVRVISPQGVPMANLGRVISPLNVGIPPLLKFGLGPNGNIILVNENIGQYAGSFSPLGDARSRNNGGQPPNHQPPTDSRYFPRQPTVGPYFQPQNDNAQITGMAAYQGMGAFAEAAEYNLPEFSPQQRFKAEVSELASVDSFGLGSEASSRYLEESAWEPLPTPPIEAPRTRFRFNKTAKNLPEGLKPYDELPVNLTHQQQPQPNTEMENQYILYNYPSSSINYHPSATNNQPIATDPYTPGPSVAVTNSYQQNTDDQANTEMENQYILYNYPSSSMNYHPSAANNQPIAADSYTPGPITNSYQQNVDDQYMPGPSDTVTNNYKHIATGPYNPGPVKPGPVSETVINSYQQTGTNEYTPGPSDKVQETETSKMDLYSQIATNAVLNDLHNLAVRVTSNCSDSEDSDNLSDLEQE